MDQIKKKPGRPRKYAAVPIEACGIVDEPINDDDITEMVYDNPLLFKKMFSLFAAYGCIEIIISFEPARVVFASMDHHGRTFIRTVLDAAKLNYYYCPEVIRVAVKKDRIMRVMSTLDKSHHKITFVLKENWRGVMYIVMRDFSYENDEIFEVELIDANALPINIDIVYPTDDYPIKFTLEATHFKKKLTDISKISPRFSIIKSGGEPLGITYTGSDRITCSSSYPNSDKINLVSTIADDDTFSASFHSSTILPFAKNCIGSHVRICVDKYRNGSFIAEADVCRVEMYTEIIRLVEEPNAANES